MSTATSVLATCGPAALLITAVIAHIHRGARAAGRQAEADIRARARTEQLVEQAETRSAAITSGLIPGDDQ
ncbi:hypothetical protein [Kitasatospora sp. NPDC050543]|uniref:hypothetical protein n=1 Tax=Kitasatospora sp. NPDC050543 TaxID=3364054 RepID=UPI0037A33A4D